MADQTTSLRRCIGSARFGIDAHEAPVEDFPRQPSQKDGLGRMCKPHWNQYTAGLARDRKARLALAAADGGAATATLGRRTAKEARAAKPEPIRTKAPRAARKTAADPIAENAEAGIE